LYKQLSTEWMDLPSHQDELTALQTCSQLVGVCLS